jgi:hypothetical protein
MKKFFIDITRNQRVAPKLFRKFSTKNYPHVEKKRGGPSPASILFDLKPFLFGGGPFCGRLNGVRFR